MSDAQKEEFEKIWLKKNRINKYGFAESISRISAWNRKSGAFSLYKEMDKEIQKLKEENCELKELLKTVLDNTVIEEYPEFYGKAKELLSK